MGARGSHADGTAEDRAEAREWARQYHCPHCGAYASVGYKYVKVDHSRNCPLWRGKGRKCPPRISA